MQCIKELENALNIIKKAKETKQNLIVYDTETEGLSAKEHHIIQCSAKKLDPVTLEEVDSLNEYINPLRPLSPKIVEITGITDDLLENYMEEKYVFPVIEKFFGDHPIVIGHNVSFDNRMLSAMYERNGRLITFTSIDTCQIARELLGNEVKDHKLITVAQYYGADAGITFHCSDDDVKATYRIFKIMINQNVKHKVKKQIIPNSIGYFSGYRGHNRIYIHTNVGAVFYDQKNKTWDSKDADVSELDVKALCLDLYNRYHVNSDEELFKKIQMAYFERMNKMVGTVKSFSNESSAMEYAKKMNNKHFDTQTDQCSVKLIAFYKSKAGSNVEL